jgi:hypothetical protein
MFRAGRQEKEAEYYASPNVSKMKFQEFEPKQGIVFFESGLSEEFSL